MPAVVAPITADLCPAHPETLSGIIPSPVRHIIFAKPTAHTEDFLITLHSTSRSPTPELAQQFMCIGLQHDLHSVDCNVSVSFLATAKALDSFLRKELITGLPDISHVTLQRIGRSLMAEPQSQYIDAATQSSPPHSPPTEPSVTHNIFDMPGV